MIFVQFLTRTAYFMFLWFMRILNGEVIALKYSLEFKVPQQMPPGYGRMKKLLVNHLLITTLKLSDPSSLTFICTNFMALLFKFVQHLITITWLLIQKSLIISDLYLPNNYSTIMKIAILSDKQANKTVCQFCFDCCWFCYILVQCSIKFLFKYISSTSMMDSWLKILVFFYWEIRNDYNLKIRFKPGTVEWS